MGGSDQSAAKVCQVIVSVETLEFLREFMTQINTQDNRATATPYYYELHQRAEDIEYENEYTGEIEEEHIQEGPIEYGRTIFFTEKAAEAYIQANRHNLPKSVFTYIQWAGRNPEIKQLLTAIGQLVGIPYERK